MEEQRYQRIINIYRIIFGFSATYLVIVLASIVGLLLFFYFFTSQNYTGQADDPYTIQKSSLVKWFKKFLSQTVGDADVSISILQGGFQIKNKIITSQNNLLSYKWFTVPRYFATDSADTFKAAAYFEKADYDTGQLAKLTTLLVLQDNQDLLPLMRNTQLPLISGNILDTFNIACLFDTKLYPQTCNYYLEDFLSSLFVYQLSGDYTNLNRISQRLDPQSTYGKLFCEQMDSYLLYSNDSNQALADIFNYCGSTHADFFKQVALFIDIQRQLDNKVISTDVYKDASLNAYKLLSYQQILYYDIQSNRIRTNQYTLYLNYVKELLKYQTIPSVYLDEIYWFNNYYLRPKLLSDRYSQQVATTKAELSLIIKNLDTLNIWDKISGIIGLNQAVHNTAVLSTVPISSGSVSSSSGTTTTSIDKKLQNISYLHVTSSTISGTAISLQGQFLLEDKQIATKLQLSYQDDTFYVRSISLPEYSKLQSIVTALSVGKKVSLRDVYTTIGQNFALYTSADAPDVPSTPIVDTCQSIRGSADGFGIQILWCTSDQLKIKKWTITYDIFLANYLPQSMSISDTGIQAAVAKSNLLYNMPITTWFVADLLAIQAQVADTGHAGSADSLTVIDTFQKYLAVTPADIAEQNGKILVDFTLGGIDFLAYYSLNTALLQPRYFKTVLLNDKPLPIQNLSLTLNDANKTTLAGFIKSPLEYIKSIDLNAWKSYTQRQ